MIRNRIARLEIMKFKEILDFKDTTLGKLYLEFSFMILVGVVILLTLIYHLFSYEDILSFVSDLWLPILILSIIIIGIFDRIKSIKKYKIYIKKYVPAEIVE